MGKREKSFRDKYGNRVERDAPVCTKTGIILYKGRGDNWMIDYPDLKQYGGVKTIKLMNLIYHLGKGKRLDEARELADLITSEE